MKNLSGNLMMCAACIGTTILVVATPARSQEGFYHAINIGSYHSDREAGWNEKNWGYGLGYRKDNLGAEAGFYRNSIQETTFSAYALSHYTVEVGSEAFRFGVFGGLANGYDALPTAPHGIIPIVGLQANIGPAQLRLGPVDKKGEHVVVTYQMTF